MPSESAGASTAGCSASGSRRGAPIVTTPVTSSGWRRASTWASIPPRLWPTTATGSPSARSRSARRATRALGAVDVALHAGRERAVAGGGKVPRERLE